MKPLYLEGARPTRVVLDGPSLGVSVEGEADRRYPLGRLSRVLAGGDLWWETGALAACLERGIPVTFLRRGGSAAGVALPLHSADGGLTGRVEEFLGRPNWKSLYENWRRSRERREVLRTLRHFRIRTPDLRPAAVRMLLESRLGALAPAGCLVPLRRHWTAMLVSLAAEKSAALGLRAERVMGRRPGFDLLADLAAILAWRFWADLEVWLAAEPELAFASEVEDAFEKRGRANWRRVLTRLFEARRQLEERRFGQLLDGFDYWLGGLR